MFNMMCGVYCLLHNECVYTMYLSSDCMMHGVIVRSFTLVYGVRVYVRIMLVYALCVRNM